MRRSKLGQPIRLGYCNVGLVRNAGMRGFKVGDRIVSSGPHADVLACRRICAKIPDSVSDEAAVLQLLLVLVCRDCGWRSPRWAKLLSLQGLASLALMTFRCCVPRVVEWRLILMRPSWILRVVLVQKSATGRGRGRLPGMTFSRGTGGWSYRYGFN